MAVGTLVPAPVRRAASPPLIARQDRAVDVPDTGGTPAGVLPEIATRTTGGAGDSVRAIFRRVPAGPGPPGGENRPRARCRRPTPDAPTQVRTILPERAGVGRVGLEPTADGL